MEPCGLAARDVLRLEMGYPLHGQELTEDRTPFESGLGWAVDLDKGPFIGREAVIRQLDAGLPSRLRGLRMTDKLIPRPHYDVYAGEERIGETSSGSFSPMLKRGIALAFLSPADDHEPGDVVEIDVRGKRGERPRPRRRALSSGSRHSARARSRAPRRSTPIACRLRSRGTFRRLGRGSRRGSSAGRRRSSGGGLRTPGSSPRCSSSRRSGIRAPVPSPPGSSSRRGRPPGRRPPRRPRGHDALLELVRGRPHGTPGVGDQRLDGSRGHQVERRRRLASELEGRGRRAQLDGRVAAARGDQCDPDANDELSHSVDRDGV
jgi:hypothetical protein